MFRVWALQTLFRVEGLGIIQTMATSWFRVWGLGIKQWYYWFVSITISIPITIPSSIASPIPATSTSILTTKHKIVLL